MGLDDDGKAYKELVLDVFLGKGAETLPRRAALLRLLPGDWRVHGTLVWKRLSGETKEQVVNILSTSLTPLLFGHAPFEFPRSRWTGAERTFEDVGLPACIHNMSLPICKQFRRDLGETDTVVIVAPPGPAAPDLAGAAALPIPVAPPHAEGGAAAAGAADVPGDSGESRGDSIRAAPVKKNKEHRSKSLLWSSTNPGYIYTLKFHSGYKV